MSPPGTDGIKIPSRGEAMERFRAEGGRVAAVFPVHSPRALLRVHRMLPVEVWGPPGVDTGLGDAHLQAYVCSIVRCGLSFVLRGGLDGVDVMVVPHACDSLQGLGSILLDFTRPAPPVLPFYLPREKGPVAIDFLVAELEALSAKLSAVSGVAPGPDELAEAVAREERADGRLGRLADARPRLALSDREFYRLVRTREYLPAEQFCALADEALAGALDAPRPGVPVVLSGILPEPMDVLDPVTGAGGMVVADDLACCGRRHYPAGTSEEPLRRVAESLLGGPPDTTRGDAVSDRIVHLRRLVEKTGARGVVFYSIKFCEPEQFYLPQVRRGLEEAGIRSVEVEGDLGENLPDQARTRIEAFLETIA